MLRRARRCEGCSTRPRPQGRSVPRIVRRLLLALCAVIGVACGQRGFIDLLPTIPMDAASGTSDTNCGPAPPTSASAPPVSAPSASAPPAPETSAAQPPGPTPPMTKPTMHAPSVAGPGCEAGANCPAMPVCEVDSGHCVECLVDGDCPPEHPFCRVSDQTCVDCLVNGDCGDPTKTCDPKSNHCVAPPRCAAAPGH
jgi:hypothetical protein